MFNKISKEILNRAYYWTSFDPEKRAERFNDEYEQAQNDFENFVNAQNITAEQKQFRVDAQKWREISQTLEFFVDYKKGSGWFNAFQHLKGAFTTQAKNGNFAMCDKILEYLQERQAEGLKIDKNIKILSDILDEWKAKLATPQESTEKEVDGVRIVENTEENRLQLFFDGKPEADTITLLKQHAFKWSPRFKAWQRILTPNAKYALNKYILPKLTAGEEC